MPSWRTHLWRKRQATMVQTGVNPRCSSSQHYSMFVIVCSAFLGFGQSSAFVPSRYQTSVVPWGIIRHGEKQAAVVASSLSSTINDETTTMTMTQQEERTSSTTMDTIEHNDNNDENEDEPTFMSAPLKYIGPYPCLSLKFPNLSTSSQRTQNISGIALDFVLDTGANTNTIQEGVASELKLEAVGEAPGGVGASGVIQGAASYLLGECELDGVIAPPPTARNDSAATFVGGLIASALPVASPAAAGLLSSTQFLDAFPGGVEFQWGGGETSVAVLGEVIKVPPSVTFYREKNDTLLMEGAAMRKWEEGGEGSSSAKKEVLLLHRAPIQRLPITNLPTIKLEINGVEIPALLDTGSPVTVFNSEAAKLVGIEVMEGFSSSSSSSQDEKRKKKSNPFAKFNRNLKTARAAARGDVLLLAPAAAGQAPVGLIKSKTKVESKIAGATFGEGHVYVGNLPGLAAMEKTITDGVGKKTKSPAVILGMDVLRRRPRMVYRPDEVIF